MHNLHEKALTLAKEFKRVEFELITVLQKIDSQKLFRTLGFASLFDYTTRALGLSESVAYGLITVSRKSTEVPELKAAIGLGELTVARAKVMTSVLTPENASELIEKAKIMTHRELEKEVASLNPKAHSKERTKYIAADRIQLNVNLSEAIMKMVKRSQDLESQRTREATSLEATLGAMAAAYLEKNDPVLKAQRVLKKPSAQRAHKKYREDGSTAADRTSTSGTVATIEKIATIKKVAITGPAANRRTPLSAELKRKINQRDQGQCVTVNSDGRRCYNRRWLEVHHLVPVSQGGENKLENLMTVCFFHHKMIHESAKQALRRLGNDFCWYKNQITRPMDGQFCITYPLVPR